MRTSSAAIAGVVVSLLMAGSAYAGNWMQPVCVNPNNSVASNAGWTPEESSDPNNLSGSAGFFTPNPSNPVDSRGCLFVVLNRGDGGDSIWFQYATPPGSTIAGGSLNFEPIYAESKASYPNGEIDAVAWSPEGSIMNSFWSGSPGFDEPYANPVVTATIPAEPAGNVLDFGLTLWGQGYIDCGTCTVQINSGGILLANNSSPAGSGFGGALIAPGSVHGTAGLTFTATDPGGPGVYRVTLKMDGNTVYQGTPNTQGGTCVSQGTDPSTGAWIFDGQAPCPQTVDVDVPVNTATLTDGEHQLQVIVQDAAQNASTVLDQTITTDNRTSIASTTTESFPSSPAASSATAIYAFKLDPKTASITGSVLRRRYDRSRVTLSGTVLNSAGAPAPNVTVSAQAAALTGMTWGTVAQAVTDGSGHFTITIPRGDSRQLKLVAGAGDVVFKQLVTPNVTLRVRALSGARVLFTGRVAIDTGGSPSPLVLLEDHDPADRMQPWPQLGSVTVGKDGRFRYVYHASRLTIGYAFAWRAVTPAVTGYWQGAASPMRTATVTG